MSSILLPKQPFTHLQNKPKIPQRAKAMTIAIGFRCADGVVLCADQKITGGHPGFEKKIRPINQEQDCFLVYAGVKSFTRELLEKLQKLSVQLSGEELKELIRTEYKGFLQVHYTNEADESLKTWSEIIFSLREGDTVKLYASDGNNLQPVTKYIAYGTGSDLADPFLYAYFSRTCVVNQAANLGIYTLSRIKDFAENCGG